MTDFNLRVALQTLLKEYIEVTKSPKDKMHCQLHQVKMRPRRKARKYVYAIGTVLKVLFLVSYTEFCEVGFYFCFVTFKM